MTKQWEIVEVSGFNRKLSNVGQLDLMCLNVNLFEIEAVLAVQGCVVEESHLHSNCTVVGTPHAQVLFTPLECR